MKTVYRKTNPHLFDVAIDEIQTALDNECSWLNTIFGRCERLVKEINGNKYYTANWHKAGNDYIWIAPDEGLGNFCFFVLDEPTDLENYFAGDVTRSTIGFSLIVWCDLRTISEGRDTEAVKEELLQILNGRTHLRLGRMTIDKVYERAENVFREFDYDEIDNQFMMHPFAGFRIEGELMVDTLCDAYIPPTPPVELPYIKGKIVDGSRTFTFKVNGNDTINVNVDVNGVWKWEVDRELTTLNYAFQANTQLLELEFYKINTLTSAQYAFDGTRNIYKCLFKECDASNLLSAQGMFQNMGANYPKGLTLVLPDNFQPTNCERTFATYRPKNGTPIDKSVFARATNIYISFGSAQVDSVDFSIFNRPSYNYPACFTFSGNDVPKVIMPKLYATNSVQQSFFGDSHIEIVFTDTIECNVPFSNCSKLNKESVLGAINAAAANVTYALHATLYAKCASGGEWHTDIQAAIDAKAAQGFTVTLISA